MNEELNKSSGYNLGTDLTESLLVFYNKLGHLDDVILHVNKPITGIDDDFIVMTRATFDRSEDERCNEQQDQQFLVVPRNKDDTEDWDNAVKIIKCRTCGHQREETKQ